MHIFHSNNTPKTAPKFSVPEGLRIALFRSLTTSSCTHSSWQERRRTHVSEKGSFQKFSLQPSSRTFDRLTWLKVNAKMGQIGVYFPLRPSRPLSENFEKIPIWYWSRLGMSVSGSSKGTYVRSYLRSSHTHTHTWRSRKQRAHSPQPCVCISWVSWVEKWARSRVCRVFESVIWCLVRAPGLIHCIAAQTRNRLTQS